MFKCLECGNLFEEGEETRWTTADGEPMKGCPCCKGAYDETYACEICGSYRFADELYKGLCIDCIGELMDKEHMTEYLKAADLEAEFYVGIFYDSNSEGASKELIGLARGGFLQKVALEALQKKEGSLATLREFITDYGIEEYVDWLKGAVR